MNTLRDLPKSATIQVVASDGTRQSIPCTLDSIAGRRLSLTSRNRVPASTAVHIEHNDALFLGEVMACTHNVDDSWHLEVNVEQVLTGLQSLMTLRARLLGESVAEMASALSARG